MTPLSLNKTLSEILGVNLFIKRDDLYPISGGGNKGRKAEYILRKCLGDNCNAIVTCGGAQSNHVRAIAIRCCELGIKCTIVIHDKIPNVISGNYLILKQLGVKIVHCEMSDVSSVMDKEMDIFKADGHYPFYIWGGGHSVEGSHAYYEAVKEIKSQQADINFDYIVHASGTGTTQAGLHCGAKDLFSNCQVIGVSIARNHERGAFVIKESVEELCQYLNLPISYSENIIFDDNYSCGGYEKYNKSLLGFIEKIAKNSGLILDPTYTGKAFLGLSNLIENGMIKKGSNVIFWNTGGLLNLMSFNK